MTTTKRTAPATHETTSINFEKRLLRVIKAKVRDNPRENRSASQLVNRILAQHLLPADNEKNNGKK